MISFHSIERHFRGSIHRLKLMACPDRHAHHETHSTTGPPGDAAPSMLADPLAFLEQTTAVHGGVAGLVLGGEYVVLVSDPAVAKDVLMDRASIFVKV